MPTFSIAAGLAAGVAFVRRQRTLADPLIDLRLFRSSAFSAALAANTLALFAMVGTELYFAQYLQLVLGLSPLLAVLATGSVVMSVGIASAGTLGTDLIVDVAPPERAGAASGISETGTELGGALGIAVLGSIGTAVYRSQVADTFPAEVPPDAAEAARDTLGGAVAAGDRLPDPLATGLLDAAREAFIQGLHLAAITSAALVLGHGYPRLGPAPRRARGYRARRSTRPAARSSVPGFGTRDVAILGGKIRGGTEPVGTLIEGGQR